MKRISKKFGAATVIYLFLLVFETFYELFQIRETKSIVTFLGISIDSQITSKDITTTFGLTANLILPYLFFVSIFTLLAILLVKKKNA